MFGEYMFLFAPQQVGISYKVKKTVTLSVYFNATAQYKGVSVI